MPAKGVTQAVRGRLMRSISAYISQNDDKNYNLLRPERTRLLPVSITDPDYSEIYNAFGVTLSQCYDISFDEHGLPSSTSSTQLPKDHIPQIYEYELHRELIKLHAFHHGTITEEIAITFLPPDLRGDLSDPRAREFINKLIKSKENLRRRLINETMLPLVLFWCNSQKFVQGPFSTPQEMEAFWVARIEEDTSVLWWWLRPLACVLNLPWLLQTKEPATVELRNLKSNLTAYFKARMVQTADLVYLHSVDHDPKDGLGFLKRQQQVTKGLQGIKEKDSVSQYFVPISEWPSFQTIKRTPVKKVGEMIEGMYMDIDFGSVWKNDGGAGAAGGSS